MATLYNTHNTDNICPELDNNHSFKKKREREGERERGKINFIH